MLDDTCSVSFDQTKAIRCASYVYKTDEVSILNGVSRNLNDFKRIVLHAKEFEMKIVVFVIFIETASFRM